MKKRKRGRVERRASQQASGSGCLKRIKTIKKNKHLAEKSKTLDGSHRQGAERKRYYERKRLGVLLTGAIRNENIEKLYP